MTHEPQSSLVVILLIGRLLLTILLGFFVFHKPLLATELFFILCFLLFLQLVHLHFEALFPFQEGFCSYRGIGSELRPFENLYDMLGRDFLFDCILPLHKVLLNPILYQTKLYPYEFNNVVNQRPSSRVPEHLIYLPLHRDDVVLGDSHNWFYLDAWRIAWVFLGELDVHLGLVLFVRTDMYLSHALRCTGSTRWIA